ncbi:hypothetical protein AB8Q18_10580 [Neisseriaceae bacterium CLB008]
MKSKTRIFHIIYLQMIALFVNVRMVYWPFVGWAKRSVPTILNHLFHNASAISLLISRFVSPLGRRHFFWMSKRNEAKKKHPTLSARYAGALVGPRIAGGKNSYLSLRPNTQTCLP